MMMKDMNIAGFKNPKEAWENYRRIALSSLELTKDDLERLELAFYSGIAAGINIVTTVANTSPVALMKFSERVEISLLQVLTESIEAVNRVMRERREYEAAEGGKHATHH